jgi:hypothetical protein
MEREVRYRIVGDASSGVAASKEAAAGLGNLSDGAKEAGKHTEAFNVHGRDMHKIMHALNEIAPGLGSAFKVIFNPATIGITATLVAIQTVSKWLDDYKEKIEKIREQQAQLKVAAWEAQVEATEKATSAAREYNERLKEIAENHDAVQKKEEARLAVLKAQLEVVMKLFGKDEESKESLTEKGSAQELALKETFLKEAMLKKDELKKISDQAEAAVQAGAPGGVEAKQAEKRISGRNIDELQKKSIDASALVNNIISGGGTAPSFLIERAAKASKKLAEAEAAQEADNKIVDEHKAATGRLTKALEKAVSNYEKASQHERELGEEISKGHSVFDIQRSGRAQAAFRGASGLTFAGFPAIPDNPFTERMFHGMEAERAKGRGEKLSEEQTGDIQFLADSLSSRGASGKQVIQILKALQAQDRDFETELARLWRAVRNKTFTDF